MLGAVSRRWLNAVAVLAFSQWVQAEVFRLPPVGDDLVGGLVTVSAGPEDTLIDIARKYGLGYDEIRAANPAIDSWMPRTGSTVILPKLYLLPMAPREGIVINVSEMRLYYYPKAKKGEAPTVEIYPVSIGRGDWNTPLVTTRVTGKIKNPTWTPPKSIREEHAADGDILPKVWPAGPDNPLGLYALRMSLPSYLIHGTNKEFGIGMQVTHGCMRLYPEHIERLFNTVPVGTPVRIVNQRYKAGWHQGALYLEVHPQLEGPHGEADRGKTPMVEAITSATKLVPSYPVNWDRVDELDLESTGIPGQVGQPVAGPVVAR
ncbi:MAG: L,D-transpeptidase family protein [Spongiibacteraceae bacterium]